MIEIPTVTHCRVLIARASGESLKIAETKLRELHHLNKYNHNVLHMVEILILLAMVFNKRNQTNEVLSFLKDALGLAAQGGLIRPFVEAGQGMADMLKRLSRKKVNVNYIMHIFASFKAEKTGAVQELTNNKTVHNSTLSLDLLIEPLSKREIEVLSHLALGNSNKEIAKILFLSPETVKNTSITSIRSFM